MYFLLSDCIYKLVIVLFSYYNSTAKYITSLRSDIESDTNGSELFVLLSLCCWRSAPDACAHPQAADA